MEVKISKINLKIKNICPTDRQRHIRLFHLQGCLEFLMLQADNGIFLEFFKLGMRNAFLNKDLENVQSRYFLRM